MPESLTLTWNNQPLYLEFLISQFLLENKTKTKKWTWFVCGIWQILICILSCYINFKRWLAVLQDSWTIIIILTVLLNYFLPQTWYFLSLLLLWLFIIIVIIIIMLCTVINYYFFVRINIIRSVAFSGYGSIAYEAKLNGPQTPGPYHIQKLLNHIGSLKSKMEVVQSLSWGPLVIQLKYCPVFKPSLNKVDWLIDWLKSLKFSQM